MSPTRRSARRSNCNATFHVDSEVEIRSSLWRNGTLGDEGLGAVPPNTPIDGSVDFPELNGPINEDLSPMPLFDQRIMKDSLMDRRKVTSTDGWVFELINLKFRFKDLDLEDDHFQFRRIHSSNLFVIHSVVSYDGDGQEFLPASIRYARKNLHFIFFSIDDPGDFELAPVASFHPKLSESQRFYTEYRLSKYPKNNSVHYVSLHRGIEG